MPKPFTHVPVMMQEVLTILSLKPGAVVADGTLGLAGHATEFGLRIAPGGLLIGIDKDKEMLENARTRLEEGCKDIDLALFHTDFRSLPELVQSTCAERGRRLGADAIFLDLGLNNAQIENPERGITFREGGPLDMRMDRSSGETAASVLNRLTGNEIEQILWDYADERWAKKISSVIVERRKQTPLQTTADLVDCVFAAIPASLREKRIHPATRTFQAIRIYVNQELEGLEEALLNAAKCLTERGILVVLSYHSGEDRAAKIAFKDLSKSEPFRILTPKPLVPSETEARQNPKARSAKLRAILRLPN